MRILFLNQFFPPDPAPTGILFREIADECVRAGHEVDFVDAGQDYRAGQQKGGRMKRELSALRRMVAAGKARPRADVVVSGTSPPCLAVFADRVARRHRARHFHWAMDVYPEIAVALGEIGRRSPVAWATRILMGRAYRRCEAVVALDEDMAGVLARHRVRARCIKPWVTSRVLEQLAHAAISQGAAAGAPWTWLYSGNLGRAHEYETLLNAQKLIESRGSSARLIFQGGGPSWPRAQQRANELGLRNCEWRGYAPEEELVASLLRSNALVVTQRPETQGLLWPSKLALVTTLARPLAFVGPVEGAIARELRSVPHATVIQPGETDALARWVNAQQELSLPGSGAVDAAAERDRALGEWMRLLAGEAG